MFAMNIMIMEVKNEQSNSLLSAQNRGRAFMHISYKKVILISNACQPSRAKDVRPQPLTSIDKRLKSNKLPIITGQNKDFGYLIPSTDYKPVL